MHFTKEFQSKVLSANQDPDYYITELEALQVKLMDLSNPITNKSLILHILNNLTRNYEMEVKMLELKMETLKDQIKEITIDDVRTELSLRFERLKRQAPKPVEHAMYMGNRFKGKCNWCGVIGHKATECTIQISGKPQTNNEGKQWTKGKTFNNNSNGKQAFDIRMSFCTYCKIKGHTVEECRKKKRETGSDSGMVKELACIAVD
jgi:hypothetical protein